MAFVKNDRSKGRKQVRYRVVEFENGGVSAVPSKWLIDSGTRCVWPKGPANSYIKSHADPKPGWNVFNIKRIFFEEVDNHGAAKVLESKAEVQSTFECTDQESHQSRKREAFVQKKRNQKRQVSIASDDSDVKDSSGNDSLPSETFSLNDYDAPPGIESELALPQDLDVDITQSNRVLDRTPNVFLPSHSLGLVNHAPETTLYLPPLTPTVSIQAPEVQRPATIEQCYFQASSSEKTPSTSRADSRKPRPRVSVQTTPASITNQSFSANRSIRLQETIPTASYSQGQAFGGCGVPNSCCEQLQARQQAFEKTVLELLVGIKNDVKEVLTRSTVTHQTEQEDIISTIPVTLPLESKESLAQLEEWLSDKENKSVLVTYLCTFGGKKLGDVVRIILRKLFRASVARQINFGGRNGKIPFSSSVLLEIVKCAVRKNKEHKTVTDYEIEKVVIDFFKNSRDLEGGRLQRVNVNNNVIVPDEAPAGQPGG